MIAKFTSYHPCGVCSLTMKEGQEIGKCWIGWVHQDCIEESEVLKEVVNRARKFHQVFTGKDDISYSVNYSIADAMKYCSSVEKITQEEYDKVFHSNFYRTIWNHVSD